MAATRSLLKGLEVRPQTQAELDGFGCRAAIAGHHILLTIC
jgi:hypothetical protein